MFRFILAKRFQDPMLPQMATSLIYNNSRLRKLYQHFIKTVKSDRSALRRIEPWNRRTQFSNHKNQAVMRFTQQAFLVLNQGISGEHRHYELQRNLHTFFDVEYQKLCVLD